MFTNFGRELVFSADLCYNEANEKPPSEREVTREAYFTRSEGTNFTEKALASARAFSMSMEDEKTIRQKSLSQKEFLALEYHASQKATLRFSNPLPKLYTRLLNREVRQEFLESSFLQLHTKNTVFLPTRCFSGSYKIRFYFCKSWRS